MRSKDVIMDMLVLVNITTESGKVSLQLYKNLLNLHDYPYTPYFYIRGYSKFSKRWSLENRETGLTLFLSSKDFEKVRT